MIMSFYSRNKEIERFLRVYFGKLSAFIYIMFSPVVYVVEEILISYQWILIQTKFESIKVNFICQNQVAKLCFQILLNESSGIQILAYGSIKLSNLFSVVAELENTDEIQTSTCIHHFKCFVKVNMLKLMLKLINLEITSLNLLMTSMLNKIQTNFSWRISEFCKTALVYTMQ